MCFVHIKEILYKLVENIMQIQLNIKNYKVVNTFNLLYEG